jgi:molybdopterin-containing oxidoreductase family iron-sulfur binding subunit
MDTRRRRVLQLLGLSTLALSTPPVFNALAKEAHGPTAAPKIGPGKDALTAKQWAMVIDTREFKTEDDVHPLIEACHKAHNVPTFDLKRHEIKWIWATEYKHAFSGTISTRFLPEELEHRPFLVLCNHCENPPCVRACPTKATFKRPQDGIVMMDFHRCIGCRFCMAACPFGARSFNYRDPRAGLKEVTNKQFPTRMKGVVEKCSFCVERLAEGKMPACVDAAKGKLTFGDLFDKDSEVRELIKTNFTLRRKINLGTEPAVYYIV